MLKQQAVNKLAEIMNRSDSNLYKQAMFRYNYILLTFLVEDSTITEQVKETINRVISRLSRLINLTVVYKLQERYEPGGDEEQEQDVSAQGQGLPQAAAGADAGEGEVRPTHVQATAGPAGLPATTARRTVHATETRHGGASTPYSIHSTMQNKPYSTKSRRKIKERIYRDHISYLNKIRIFFL